MTIAETNVSLQQEQQQQQQNPSSLESLFHALDPISLLPLSHHSFIMDMERGPRYKAYSELRETKLRMKYLRQQQEEQEEEQQQHEPQLPTPPRKQVKFQSGLASGRKGSSILAQSVPDFSTVLRKENRKPVLNMLPSVMELTPPSKSFTKGSSNGVLTNSRGSVSASGGEKRRVGGGGGGGGVLMARKSYASIDELKSFSKATASAINGESRGGKNNSRVMGKTVLGYRQF